MYSVLLMGILIVVSGGIAFLGDLLGRKLGRKRISLARLRPRHTAILVSVITGMFISLFTLLALSRISYPVRVALFGVVNLLEERARLEKEVATLRKTEAHLAEEVAKRDKELSQLKVREEEQRKLLVSLSERVSNLIRERRKMEAYIKDVRNKARKLEEELAQTETQLRSTREEYRRALSALRDSNLELERKKKEVQNYAEEVRSLEVKSARLQGELTSLQKEQGDLLAQIEDLRTQRNILQISLEELKAQNESLKAEVARKEQEIMGVTAYYGEVLGRKVIFPKGSEVARGVIECGRPVDRIRVSLRSLLKLASDSALKKGAGIGEDGKAVSLMKFVEGPHGLYVFPEEAVLQGVAMKLSQMQGSVVARLIALRNFVEGERVLVDLELYQNRLVFQKGEIVGSLALDGHMPEGALLERIITFLRTDVREKALQRGLIPSEDEVVGEVPLKEIVDLVSSVKGERGKVIVKAVAKKQIWSADPLSLTFEVEKASS